MTLKIFNNRSLNFKVLLKCHCSLLEINNIPSNINPTPTNCMIVGISVSVKYASKVAKTGVESSSAEV